MDPHYILLLLPFWIVLIYQGPRLTSQRFFQRDISLFRAKVSLEKARRWRVFHQVWGSLGVVLACGASYALGRGSLTDIWFIFLMVGGATMGVQSIQECLFLTILLERQQGRVGEAHRAERVQLPERESG